MYVIGISGGSGSGKTYFLRRLMEHFSQSQICLLSQDHYYLPRELQPLDVNGERNFDTQESIDLASFHRDVVQLMDGKEIIKKEYTYNNPLIEARQLVIRPAPILILEGIFIFHQKSIFDLLQLKIFLDGREDIRLSRRLTRDREERGYGEEDVLYRHKHHVVPMYEKYLEPYKSEVDLVIPNNHNFENALGLLVVFLKALK